MTNRQLDNLIAEESIFRKKVCSRCGHPDYEKMTGWNNEEWREPEPMFENIGYIDCDILGYGHAVLCPSCAQMLSEENKKFMRYMRAEWAGDS